MPKTTKKTKTTISQKPIVKKIVKKSVVAKDVNLVDKKPTITFKKVKYFNKNVQISPRKLRLLVDEVRKLSPSEALSRVKFVNTKAARIMVKALQNIIADAKNNFNLDTNSLKFDTIKADEGMKLKRMDKSHGSHFHRGLIQKRHSRLVIIIKGIQK